MASSSLRSSTRLRPPLAREGGAGISCSNSSHKSSGTCRGVVIATLYLHSRFADKLLEFFIRLAREQLRPTYGQGFRGAPLQTDTEESRLQTIRAGGSRAKVTQTPSEVARS